MDDERYFEVLEKIHIPNTYWKGKTWEYKYWFRSLLQKIDSSIVFQGLPENWSNDFFMMCLWSLGYVAIFDTQRWGVSFQPCTLSGYDFYYQPTYAMVSNPHYTKKLKIGKECEILKLTPDFMGVLDIIDYYATQLAEISKGIHIGLVNAKVPMVMSASNTAQAETLKKVYDKVQSGESLVIWKDIDTTDEIIPSKEPFEVWNQDFKQTYIVHSLLEDMQLILNSFYTEIGLPVAIEKKERLVTSEADFASAQSQARIACWLNTLNESLEKINKLFDTNITVEGERNDEYDETDASSDRKLSK